ncbi:MAG: hypothetical protein FK734_11855 [Asgard group archaeon]|nr:hypothetical protein [Asgard group archaeon]
MSNILEQKIIRLEPYLYWNNPKTEKKVSIGKYNEIVELMKIRTRKRNRDFGALRDILLILGRENFVDFIKSYDAKTIIAELKRIGRILDEFYTRS